MKKIVTLEQQEIMAVNGACSFRPAELFFISTTILSITMMFFVIKDRSNRRH